MDPTGLPKSLAHTAYSEVVSTDLEDRLVEIKQSEKEKRILKMSIVQGTKSSVQTFALYGSQKKKERKKQKLHLR